MWALERPLQGVSSRKLPPVIRMIDATVYLRREPTNDTAQFCEPGGGRIDGGDSRRPRAFGRTSPLRTLWTQTACTLLKWPWHQCALSLQGRFRRRWAILHWLWWRLVDRRVGQELLNVISPLGVEANLRALEELSAGDAAQRSTLSSKLDQLEYEAQKAFEQYDAVEARNRLVASGLGGAMERKAGGDRGSQATTLESECEATFM